MFCLFVFLASFLFIHNDDCIEFDELPQPQEDPPITALSSQNTDLLPHTSPVIEGAHEMDSDGEEESSSQEASPSPFLAHLLLVPLWDQEKMCQKRSVELELTMLPSIRVLKVMPPAETA